MTEQPEPTATAPGRAEATPGELMPYIAPMLAFLLLTQLEGSFGPAWYPAAYAVKVLVGCLVVMACRSTWRDLRPLPDLLGAGLAVVSGLVVYGLWVGLEGHYPSLSLLGKRTGYDPWTLSGTWRWPFVAVRLLGLVLLVPLIEELFWRSFLMRWLIDANFLRVPIGRVTPMAAAVTSGAFALAHPEWLPALLTGLLWSGLLWRTKSLSACVLSHSVANLALGAHVLATGDWKFW
jgi:CAAX prenyl protease-like protein